MKSFAFLSAVVAAFLMSPGRGSAQVCPPGVLTCSVERALGQTGVLEDSVTDLTYRGTLRQLWAIEGPIPGFNGLTFSRITVLSEDLRTIVRSFSASFSEPGFGIAEIPATHPFGGNSYVLAPSPDLDLPLQPMIGIMDDSGVLLEPEGAFQPVVDRVTRLPPPGFFSGIDVNPSEAEIALLDDGTAGGGPHILFTNLQYEVIRGPFPVEGGGSFFGSGVAYNSDSTVLVVAQFRTTFEAVLAMEYDRMSGAYTGRTIRLDVLDTVDPPIALGLDTGVVNREPALFFYNVPNDAAYAIPLEDGTYLEAPGPVDGLNPSCTVLPDGRVQLLWDNNPDYDYDQILVFENGVRVAGLDAAASEYVTPLPMGGKYELCLETRARGQPNEFRVCCEGQSGQQLPFLPPTQAFGLSIDVDPLPGNSHLLLGMACPKVVPRKEDFRAYVIGSFDNVVRAFDYNKLPLPAEDVITIPPRQTVVQNGQLRDIAASGIALFDVEVEGLQVPMYALLDADGPNGNFVPRASIHFLKDTILPSGPFPITKGTPLAPEITNIEIPGDTGLFLVDWDADALGDLITLDTEGRRILRIRFDPAANTLRSISEAPLPLQSLTPLAGRGFPTGGISVLPSGHYLVAGGDAFDSTVVRAFLLSPFIGDPLNPDLSRSVKLIGYVEGLVTYSQLFTPDTFGRAVGPDFSFGLDSCFLEQEGTDGVGTLFYNTQHYFPTLRRSFRGNFLIGQTSQAVNPGFLAEQLVEEEVSLPSLGTYETPSATPSFFNDAPVLDYHYHLFNLSDTVPLHVSTSLVLDGTPVPEVGEAEIVVPPARSFYRQVSGRPEKTFQIQVRNLDPGSPIVRVLAGATGFQPRSNQSLFRRGDPNQDRIADISDVVALIDYQFLGGAEPACLDSADADDTGVIDLADPIFMLSNLFQAGPPIPLPGVESCGTDPSQDDLKPCVYSNC